VALLAVAGTAVAQDVRAQVRAFVDSLRSEEERRGSRVVLPDVELPADRAVEIEYRMGHHTITYGLLRFELEGDTVRVARTEFVTYLPDVGLPPFAKAGLRVEEARLTRATYDAFVHGLLLLGSVRLEPQTECVKGHTGGSLFLKVGDALRTEVTVPYARPSEVLQGRIDDSGRGLLWFRFVATRMRTWRLKKVADPALVAGHLLAGLAEVQGWRRDLRVLGLGWLGHEPALVKLRELDRNAPLVNLAIHQIELVVECESSPTPPKVFQKLLNWGFPGVSEWAHELLKSRYPAAYKDVLKMLFSSPTPADRLRAVQEMEKVDATDHSLARAALEDPAAEVRVEAARILKETEPLLAIVRDRKLRLENGWSPRCAAIIYLTWDYPPTSNPKQVGPVLVAVATDESDDVRIRHGAAVGLGCLGYREAIPVLLKLLMQHPVQGVGTRDLRSGAAQALGCLRAGEGVGALIELFEASPRKYNTQRQELGNALGRIGDSRGLDALRKAAAAAKEKREHSWWERCATYAEAIQARDAKTLLTRGLTGGCPAYIVTLLADLFDVKELRSLLREDWLSERKRSLVVRAIALRESR
jgi:hypothetical protein